jgi:putative lipoprotein
VPTALLLACVLSTSRGAAASSDPDPWFGRDKALHFSVSAGIAMGSYAVAASLLDARGHALLVAGGFTLAVGAGKETLDLTGFGDPSWKDFTWDAIGTLSGLVVAWGIDLLVRGVGDRHPLFEAPRRSLARMPTTMGVGF